MPQKMLEGTVDRRDDIIRQQEEVIMQLRLDLAEAQQNLTKAGDASNRAISSLRGILSPLYRALQEVFGEIESITGNEPEQPSNVRHAKWDRWKQQLGGRKADMIQALLEHDELSAVQLMAMLKAAKQTVYDTASALGKLGLVVNRGGKYSLKEL